MKRHWLDFSLLVILVCNPSMPIHSQGTFRNLDFEFASLVPIPSSSSVQFAPAFPGWTGYVGGIQQTSALYNAAALDTSAISIIDGNWPFPFGNSAGVIQGNFTVILQAGVRPGTTSEPADTTLAQSGQVPLGTESLQFSAFRDFGPTGSFAVTLGGQILSLIPVAAGSNHTIFRADIHPWAGQTTELGFTVFADRPHQGNEYLYLDSIQFSNKPIPEPGVFGLFALGALLLGWRWRKRRDT